LPALPTPGNYTTDVSKAGSEAKLIDVINDLAGAEHRH